MSGFTYKNDAPVSYLCERLLKEEGSSCTQTLAKTRLWVRGVLGKYDSNDVAVVVVVVVVVVVFVVVVVWRRVASSSSSLSLVVVVVVVVVVVEPRRN